MAALPPCRRRYAGLVLTTPPATRPPGPQLRPHMSTLPLVPLPESAHHALQYYRQEFEQLYQPSQAQVDIDLGKCSLCLQPCNKYSVQCGEADRPSEFPQAHGVRKLHKNPDTPALEPEVFWRWCCDPAPGVLESKAGP